MIRFEHGVGLMGAPRGQVLVDLFCSPNEFVARQAWKLYPKARVEVVGTPKLDDLLKLPREGGGSTIGVSFHWDSRGAPNGRWLFPQYRAAIGGLAKHRRVLGHGHPRVWGQLKPFYESVGIEPVEHLANVVRLADVYVADATSTVFEFAALDRPVVQLVGAHHSDLLQRYPVGLKCESPDALEDVIAAAFEDPPEVRELRHASIEELYPFRSIATARAVDTMRDWAGSRG